MGGSRPTGTLGIYQHLSKVLKTEKSSSPFFGPKREQDILYRVYPKRFQFDTCSSDADLCQDFDRQDDYLGC